MNKRSCQVRCGAVRNAPALSGFFHLCLLWLLFVPSAVRAQLVADGQTNILDNVVTNVTGGITIGTNGSFTLLVITNGAMVTNSGGTDIIGSNVLAQSNCVTVTGAGSSWNSSGIFYIGDLGSSSELDILNGGLVTDGSGIIGQGVSSSNNLVLVSGAGSIWSNTGYLSMGGGSYNTLIVTNGGKVFSDAGSVGAGYPETSNTVLITGSGSIWNCGGSYFNLGESGGGGGNNHFLVKNGGAFITSSAFDIGNYTSSNCLTITDAGSSLQCQSFDIDGSGTGSQCIVSNGATLAVTNSSQPTMISGPFTVAIVTGAGSVWTNAGDLDFGNSSNVLSITSGGTMVNNNGYIEPGVEPGVESNTVVVAGTNSLWNNLGDLLVAGQLLITNGGTVADNNAYLGNNAGYSGNCYALVAGAGSVWTNRGDPPGNNGAIYVGNYVESNQLVVTDSGKVAATDIYVSNNGRLVVANSGVLMAIASIHNSSSGGLYIGYYTGSANQMVVSNAAVVTIGSFLQIGNSQGWSNTVTINGGTMIVSNNTTINSPGALVLNSGLFQAGSFSINNNAVQTNAIVLNGGTLQADGIAYGTFSYPQPVIVGDGIDPAAFQMMSNGTFSGGFVVANNASLTGAGTVNGNITVGNGATFAPGTTNTLSLTLNGGLMLSNGSTTTLGLNPLSGSANNVRGLTNVVYGGALQLTNLGGLAPYAPGQTYNLFYASNYSGAFNSLVPATPGAGLRWDTYELTVNGVLRVFSTNTLPPTCSGAISSAGNLVVAATAGVPYDPCYLLTSTNLATPLSAWSCVATNYLDVNGATSFTNIISPGEPARYFQLQVN